MADPTTITPIAVVNYTFNNLVEFLKPFPPKNDTETQELAQKYTSFLSHFLSQCLSHINKSLTVTSPDRFNELVKMHTLCLDCLESTGSQSSEPYKVLIPRSQLVHVYKKWGKYNEVKTQGIYILKFIKKLYSGTGTGKGGVPELGNHFQSLAKFIVDIFQTVVECVTNARCEDEPWLGNIDVEECEKSHKLLVTQLIEVGQRICSSRFSPPNDQIKRSIDLLSCVLDVIDSLCVLRKATSGNFLKSVDYCANQCRNVTVDLCGAVATHFNKLADVFSKVKGSAIELIVRLYAISFDSDLNSYSRRDCPKMGKCEEDKLLHKMEGRLTTVHGYLLSNDDNGMPMAADTEAYMSSYFTALKFLCKPISKLLISELEDTLFCRVLPNIEDAFHQFILVYRASNKDGDVCNSITVLDVAIAAFTLSFATKKKTQACTQFICDLVSTHCLQTKGLQYLHASLQNVGIVLRKSGPREEHQAYMEFNSLILEMQLKISNPLKKICNTKDPILLKSRLLIANARDSRAHGIEGVNDSIKYLSEAILIMSDPYDKDEYARDLLAQAYCLRTLCTQEAESNSKLFVQDIGNALNQWLSQKHPQSAEQTLTLLYHVGDLLSLKGDMEHHSNIYEMMFRIFTWKKVPLKKWITILWQSRSLRHCLCTSPVSDAFIMTLSKHRDPKSMKFWISCMESSKSLGIGFMQSLSVISTLSSPNSCKHEHATQPLATVDDVKQAASDLISEDPASSKSLFLAAHLYYDLCERVIAKGSMIEALSYAKEAYRLRYKLRKQRFMYSTKQHNDDIFGDNGEHIQKRGYRLESFHMDPSVATSAWSSHYMDSSDLVDFILTPWNVLQCYLESTLQVGTIQEIIGNGSDAEKIFRWGKNVSLFHGLPIFFVSFSSALGQLYRKQRHWHLAKMELESAKCTLADSWSIISCSKCKLVLQVTVEKQLGDLSRSLFNNTTGNKLHQELSEAEKLYRSAVDKLKRTEWKNCVSDPEKTTSSGKIFCDCLMIGGIDVNISSTFGNKIEQEETQPKVTKKRKNSAKPSPQVQRVSYRDNKGRKMSKVGCISSCGCVCDDKDCWHCLSYGVMKSLLVESIIQMKWEITRRRLLLRLLTGIGKCLTDIEEPQGAHDVFLESVSVLVSRSTFCPSRFPISFSFLAELIEQNVTGDVFAVEHASLLYTICWFLVRSSWDKGTRNDCCDLSFISMPTVLSGLKLSFILCREVPQLFQKVSRLLSVLYTLSSSNKELRELFASKALCESQWASFFHQVSIGADFSYQLFSHLGKPTDNTTHVDVDGSSVTNSTPLSLHRLAPESVMDLEEFIINFFANLPRATIVCISVLGDTYARFLSKLMPYEYSARAWIVFSRFNSDCAPIVIALPLGSVLRGCLEDDQDLRSCVLPSPAKSWRCPWDHTVIDEVAPLFRSILEKSYATTSVIPEDTFENRKIWWKRRKKLDKCLGDLLRDMEDSWFGPWKYLLLGGALNGEHNLDSVSKNLREDLKSMCEVDVSESILRSVISCASSQQKECLSELILKKGCHIGDRSPKENSLILSLIRDSITNATHEIGDEDREPVILVPDFDIQMLPWESMPLLKNQEVYRMPSIASISCTYNRCRRVQEKVGKNSAVFPMIDPLDAYYLLNPGGDLSGTQARFEACFKERSLKGTRGISPTVDELSEALKKHDLFIYLGHGSGIKYISEGEIQKLDGCAATFLMGCSSGSLYLNGSYTPKGAPLHYLYAGAPFIVANLWDVTDKDILQFGKSMLDALTAARSTSSLDCAQCTEMVNSKSFEVSYISTFGCKHRPKVGSFMGNARQACELKSLIGAAPVCYGVPTGIRKKVV